MRRLRDYLEYIAREARRRYDAGMPVFEAAQDIALDDYSSWGDAERIVVNVNTLYREFSGATGPADINALFAQMAVAGQGPPSLKFRLDTPCCVVAEFAASQQNRLRPSQNRG